MMSADSSLEGRELKRVIYTKAITMKTVIFMLIRES